MELPKGVLSAVKSIKHFEQLLESDEEVIILLETRLSLLPKLVRKARKHGKKILVHTDLIQGLKNDDYGLEFLFHEVKPHGVISTRSNVITAAKRHNILAVQRLFLIDSQALDRNVAIMKKTQPDYVEVLPGLIPSFISEIKEELGIPIIAGGLIRTKEDVQLALTAGAHAVSTSRKELWEIE
ncbi:glycerol-3-phosphate responsive antiterminator [Pontibacillus salipaludis]|uniref:Glycerol uptake operon antiterminator regulatory protein n=1 Tax=Pontibacillus salipaludis TaxID=1697394 RepID=A0ABQ1QJH6_9BACI|nr:glycerol-3-phosphate responsive antiterminator [Pontibacillus salipaludis]GGD28733.1 glycerol uptake operon antiterminator regulatory protein [Pontibacillus salipaludis]